MSEKTAGQNVLNVCKYLVGLSFFVLSVNIYSAEKLIAIPEMLVLAGSSHENGAIHINEQRLEFETLESYINDEGVVFKVFRQRYKNIPVWGGRISTILKPDENEPIVRGYVFANIAEDIPELSPTLDVTTLENLILTYYPVGKAHNSDDSGVNPTSIVLPGSSELESSKLLHAHAPKLWILVDTYLKAHLVFELCLLNNGHDGTAIRGLVGAFNGQVFGVWSDSFDDIPREHDSNSADLKWYERSPSIIY